MRPGVDFLIGFQRGLQCNALGHFVRQIYPLELFTTAGRAGSSVYTSDRHRAFGVAVICSGPY
eukprot:scaffold105003_cov18-Prasinocladus_malaysianus.AAC.2